MKKTNYKRITTLLLVIIMICTTLCFSGCAKTEYDIELVNSISKDDVAKNSFHFGTFEKYPCDGECRLKLNPDFTYTLTKKITSADSSKLGINIEYVFGGKYEMREGGAKLLAAETCSYIETYGQLNGQGFLKDRQGDDKSDPSSLKYSQGYYINRSSNSTNIVDVDEKSKTFEIKTSFSQPLPDWGTEDGEHRDINVEYIRQKYEQRLKGEIVFYGASNFRLWDKMEEDMKPYKVQNHGIGGSTDEELLRYADRLLYPFNPSIAFLQTGSNELMTDLTIEEVLKIKGEMYDTLTKNLPDTTFIVMMALPLPGRADAWEKSSILNEYIKDYCKTHPNFTYVDATAELLADSGSEDLKTFDGKYFIKELYREDGIHLSLKGHEIWTKYMLAKLSEMGIQA